MEGISKERLIELQSLTEANGSYSLQDLISECTELNPWLPINGNTTKDRKVLLYYPDSPYDDTRILGYAFERNGFNCIKPTHYQELPDPPK